MAYAVPKKDILAIRFTNIYRLKNSEISKPDFNSNRTKKVINKTIFKIIKSNKAAKLRPMKFFIYINIPRNDTPASINHLKMPRYLD